MTRFLVYVDAVPGRLYPLVATLLELARRGHEVTVKAGIDAVEPLRAAGLHAEPLAPPIARFEPDDWKARTRFGALMSGLRQFGERARDQAADLEAAIDAGRPDVLFIDEGAWGAAAVAERSGLPWAYSLVSAPPLSSRDAPPFGLGLRPRHDRIGRARDRAVRALALGALERMIAGRINGLRAELGIPPFTTIDACYLAADAVLAYTAEPFEYPRTDWSPKVQLVGPGLWEPAGDAPPWLHDVHRPLVLVTCSTLFQNDRRLAAVACAAFADAPYDVVITTGDIDPAGFSAPGNVRVERFVPHAPVLVRAVCVVCHAGMGITQKALAHGVPVVAVPFGRDQPEVARRVEVAGAGVRLPARRLNPPRLRASVEQARLLASGARRIARAFSAAGGPPAAAEALERLARPVPAVRVRAGPRGGR
jgi:MGT family glycosyltransferase